MDFVVAGLGIGALLVVIGFAVRDVGPLIGRAADASDAEAVAWRRRREALCAGVSNALSAGGGVILIATIGAVLIGVSDSAGTWIVIVASLAGAALAGGMLARTIAAHRTTGEPGRSVTAEVPGRLPVERPARGEDAPATATLQTEMTRSAEPTAEPPPGATSDAPIVADVEERAVVAPEPELDEPFDPTKLLPEEFGEHPADEALPFFVVGDLRGGRLDDPPAESPDLPQPDALPEPAEASRPATEPEEAPDNPAPVEEPETAPAAEAGTPGSVFRSPLLADIDSTEQADAPEGGFSSQLLADVTPVDTPSQPFRSPLLADVAPQEGNARSEDSLPAVKAEMNGNAPPRGDESDEPERGDEPAKSAAGDRRDAGA